MVIDVGINVSGQVPGIWDPRDLGPPELEREVYVFRSQDETVCMMMNELMEGLRLTTC